MNNKILITINVPLLCKSYDLFIPINKKVGTIRKYCIDVINELSDNSLVNIDKLNLYDKDGSIVYDLNVYVKGSGIVNGTEFILI